MENIKLQENDFNRLVRKIVEAQSTNETCEQLKERLKKRVRKITSNQNLISAFDRAVDTNSAEPLLSFIRHPRAKKVLAKQAETGAQRLLSSNNNDIEGVLSQLNKEIDRDVKSSSIKPSDFRDNRNSKQVNEQNPWDLLDLEAQYGEPIGWMTMPWGQVPIYAVRDLKGWAKFMWVTSIFMEFWLPILSLLVVFFAWLKMRASGDCR